MSDDRLVVYVGAKDAEEALRRADGELGYGRWEEEDLHLCRSFSHAKGDKIFRVIIEVVKP